MRTHVSNVVMTRLAVIFLLTLFLSQLASAKRIAPAKVDPVVYEGIRYVAPNDDGRRGYIEAWDVATEKKLWELTVFTNRIDPKPRGGRSVGFHQCIKHPGWQTYRYIRTWRELPGRPKDERDHAI